MPLISVVITVYNAEKYLTECLESIVTQTYPDLEIIIIDDGSSDNSAEIYNAYAARDKRLKTIRHEKNCGASAARNTSLANATGDYIHFVDSDDWLCAADYYERMAEAITRIKPDIAISGYYWEGRNITRSIEKETILTGMAAKMTEICQIPTGWRYLFKRTFLTEHNFVFNTDCAIGHDDTIFVIETAYQADQMLLVPNTMYYYRKNPNSILLTRDPVKRKRLEDGSKYAWEKIQRFAAERNFDVSGLNRYIPVSERRFEVLKEAIPLISVIITVYNVGKYLAECLESIVTQTYTDLEIIIVDDGSPDNSAEIYNSYAVRDKRIKIIRHEKNRGIAHARNTGLTNAAGDYIQFVDGDDWFYAADYYERIVEAITRVNPDMAASGFFWEGRKITRAIEKETALIDIADKVAEMALLPCGWRYLFKRTFLDKHHFTFDTTVEIGHDDSIFVLEAVYEADQVLLVPHTMYHYRRNPDSILLTRDPVKSKKVEEGSKYSYEKMCRFAAEHNFDISAFERWLPLTERRFEALK